MAFPQDAVVGQMAKSEDVSITDEELQKLNDAKLQFGGSDAVFSRMTGESSHPSLHLSPEMSR